MHSTPQHGLAGKARRIRDVTRSHRLYSQQLIEEYLDWESGEEEPERFIPIKRAGEFLPSVEVVPASSSDDSGAGQFEFVHTPSGAIVEEVATAPQLVGLVDVKPVSRKPVERVGSKPTVPISKTDDPVKVQSKSTVIPVAEKPGVIRPVRARTSALPVASPKETLSTQGLLIGCAIGTVGAGILLSLMSLIF